MHVAISCYANLFIVIRYRCCILINIRDGDKDMTDRQDAVYRAKEAYRLWVTRAITVAGFALDDDHYKFFDFKTKYCVELKLNGALRKAFK